MNDDEVNKTAQQADSRVDLIVVSISARHHVLVSELLNAAILNRWGLG